MKIIRTEQEIVDYYQQEGGIFDFKGDVLQYLPLDKVKQFYKKDYLEAIEYGKEKFNQLINPMDQIKSYVEFAWEKANDCRGLSAERSLSHFENWFWLIDDNFYKTLIKLRENCYAPYGKPVLAMVCKKLQLDRNQFDNNCWQDDNYAEEYSDSEIEKCLYKAESIYDAED